MNPGKIFFCFIIILDKSSIVCGKSDNMLDVSIPLRVLNIGRIAKSVKMEIEGKLLAINLYWLDVNDLMSS